MLAIALLATGCADKNTSGASSNAPTLGSVIPSTGTAGSTMTVALTGTNFVAGSTNLAVSGTGVTASNVVVASPTSLTATFTLAASATPGARNVTVTNGAGTSSEQPFTVAVSPRPTVTTVGPVSGVVGTSVAVTITGTGFLNGGTTVGVSGGGVTVGAVTVDSPTSLTASLAIDAAATPGARTMTVTTAGGTSAPQPFTVASPQPTVTSLRQPDGAIDTNPFQILNGTQFVVDATTVTVSGSGVTVTNVTVTSSTSLSAIFVVDVAAALGPRTVTVTTPGGTSAPVTFTVTAPAQVTCAPNTQTIAAGGQARFSAVGGSGSYSWAAPGGSPTTGGDVSTFASTYASAGTYTVTVTHGTTATCSVTVQATRPTIDTFRASPETITAGQTTALSWSGINNATSCAIDNGVGAVPCGNTSTNAAPLIDTTYSLTLTGAGGTTTVVVSVRVTPGHGSQTFNATGAQQNFLVPAGVTSVTVQAHGARGGKGSSLNVTPGNGGSVTATIAVTPGETLAVFVGGTGGDGHANSPGAGGFNGGGTGPVVLNTGGGGGGASDVRQGGSGLANRVVVAGGGGGSGTGGGVAGGTGGAGGGTTGGSGATVFDTGGGTGGTAAAGGSGGHGGGGGTAGTSGASGTGGGGGVGVSGGSGGGGYFGGGGGGASNAFPSSGGGGGSSFAAPGATGVTHAQGDQTGAGQVVIIW
jgi:hypothetical protein